MSYLSIGSGDISPLLSGIKTKGYSDLWRKFLSDGPPHYNAYASPIDALRTGAILEDLYLGELPNNYFTQVKKTFSKMDVYTCSIDFGKISNGELVDFEELKTIYLPDYLSIIRPLRKLREKDQNAFLSKKFKNNYNQVQFQLMCSDLDSATLTFLSVESYNDEENKTRVIKDQDVSKFRIQRNPEVIDKIIKRGEIFQSVKNNFNYE